MWGGRGWVGVGGGVMFPYLGILFDFCYVNPGEC